MQLVKFRGKWHAYGHVNGRRVRWSLKLDATEDNRAAAERALNDLVTDVTATVCHTVAGCFAAYLEGRRSQDPRQRYSWERLRPHFAFLRPDQVNRSACRAYVANRRQAGASDGTIIRELTDLRAALRFVDKNTPAVIEAPSAPPPRDRWLTREEFAALLDAAQPTPHLVVFLHLAIATAARKGALLELRWEKTLGGPGWVDFDRGEVALGRKPNGKPRATVPMTERLRLVLLQARQQAVTDHVVEYNAAPVADIKTAFKAAVERAGIQHCTIHDLRHTAAVWMAGAGVSMSKISQVLGHTNTAVTERVYARYAPDHLRDATAALEV